MYTVLPLQHSKLSPVESAFLTPGGSNFGVAVGLGNVTRVQGGNCLARHQTTGACWGTFDSFNSKFVDNRDHLVTCYQDENKVTGIRAGNVPNPTNVMNQFASIQGAHDARAAQGAQTAMAAQAFSSCGALAGRTPLCGQSLFSALPGCSQPANSAATAPSLWNQTQWVANSNNGPPCSSYGTYSNCPNCSLSGPPKSCA